MFPNKKADTGINHMMALLVTVILLIFMFMIFSIISIDKDKRDAEQLENIEKDYLTNNAFLFYLEAPTSYKGNELTVYDFLSYSIVGEIDETRFKEASQNHFRPLATRRLNAPRQWKIIVGNKNDPAYKYGPSPDECVNQKLQTVVPLAFNGEYKVEPLTLHYSYELCITGTLGT